MTHIFHRDTHSVPPRAVAGDGVYLIDGDGRRYLDASGGAAVSCLGHSDDDVISAIQEQARALSFAHTGFFTSDPAEALGDFLIARAPAGIGWAYFTSGGSEAVETAMKIARQYFIAAGQPERARFVARRRSYHGNTLGALALGDHRERRGPFEPMLMDVGRVSSCYAYRDQGATESADAYGDRLADELEETLQAMGPETVCAFVAETVSGASLGCVPPVAGYFKKMRAVCDRHGVLMILDEVMCGMGRTGTVFACEQDGVVPDMIAIAKGLGGGYQPIGAVLLSKTICDTVNKGGQGFPSGHTYMGHPVACAGALAVQTVIEDKNLLANVRQQGAALRAALADRFGAAPHVGDIRGRGLFVGLELVRDKDVKRVFDPSLKLAGRIKRHAMAAGLICYPGQGGADGVSGDHVMLAPPFIVDENHVTEIVEKLERALDGALSEAGVS